MLCSKSPTSIGTRGSDETVDRREMARIRGGGINTVGMLPLAFTFPSLFFHFWSEEQKSMKQASSPWLLTVSLKSHQ